MNNRPKQLEILREKKSKQLYGRNPVLLRKLTPLIRRVTAPISNINSWEGIPMAGDAKPAKKIRSNKNIMITIKKKQKEKRESINLRRILQIDKKILWALR